MPHLLSVNTATVVSFGGWTGDMGSTGIDKRAVTHRVRLFDDHVDGDHVVDRKHHGGPYKAVYSYAREDAAWWEQEIGRDLPAGSFGENLTMTGISLNDLLIGERLRVGTALLQVSEPRIPCRVFAGFWDRPGLIKEFTAAGRSGTYLRIIEEGDVGSGDAITFASRPDHGVTVGQAFAARTGTGITREQLRPAFADFAPKWQAWIDAAS
jgi:MOSC domain-containing protein YiiM